VSQPQVERRLAAILAADVVGFSRLMGVDEAGTARALRGHREAISPIITEQGGRIVKTIGDGVLLEFPSVVAAVACAAAIQRLMAERNAAAPADQRMLFRIGINLGDVLIEGDDILGDGVNVAARLEEISEPAEFAPPQEYRAPAADLPGAPRADHAVTGAWTRVAGPAIDRRTARLGT